MENLRFMNIGFGNIVMANKVVAIVSPESAPLKRIIQESKAKGKIIDATYGRKTRSIIVTDNDHIILSPLQPDTVANRFMKDNPNIFNSENNSEDEELD